MRLHDWSNGTDSMSVAGSTYYYYYYYKETIVNMVDMSGDSRVNILIKSVALSDVSSDVWLLTAPQRPGTLGLGPHPALNLSG